MPERLRTGPLTTQLRRVVTTGGVGLLLVSVSVCMSATALGKPRPPAVKSKPAPAGRSAGPERDPSTPPAAPAQKNAPAPSSDAAAVVKTQESKEGIKTYQFGAVEVEGRLRTPQLIYFLRRVRAEFAATDLGHRSFLRELAETQRSPAFR